MRYPTIESIPYRGIIIAFKIQSNLSVQAIWLVSSSNIYFRNYSKESQKD